MLFRFFCYCFFIVIQFLCAQIVHYAFDTLPSAVEIFVHLNCYCNYCSGSYKLTVKLFVHISLMKNYKSEWQRDRERVKARAGVRAKSFGVCYSYAAWYATRQNKFCARFQRAQQTAIWKHQQRQQQQQYNCNNNNNSERIATTTTELVLTCNKLNEGETKCFSKNCFDASPEQKENVEINICQCCCCCCGTVA